jgi:hypothetical protein
MQTNLNHRLLLRFFVKPIVAALLLLPVCITAWAAGGRPIDYANPLVGTAPLDDPQLIGNAPGTSISALSTKT